MDIPLMTKDPFEGARESLNGALPPPRRMKFKTLDDNELVKSKWRVENLVSENALMVIGAQEKSMKSHAALGIAVSAALGIAAFRHPKMVVPVPQKVVYLTGEGGTNLAWARALRMAEVMLNRDKLGTRIGRGSAEWALLNENLLIVEEIVPCDHPQYDEWFVGTINDLDPNIIIVDPAYIYLAPGEGAAGNVFAMGSMIRDIHQKAQDPGPGNPNGRALIYVHHNNKSGDDLDLKSLSQAGFREAAESWLLLKVHTDEGESSDALEDGLSRVAVMLEAKFGSRTSARWHRYIALDLGWFNSKTMQYEGEGHIGILDRGQVADFESVRRDAEQQNRREALGRNMLHYLNNIVEPAKTGALHTAAGPSRSENKVEVRNALHAQGYIQPLRSVSRGFTDWVITVDGQTALQKDLLFLSYLWPDTPQ